MVQEVYQFIKDIPPIEDLDFESFEKYEISSFEEKVLPLIKDHKVIIITGGYFGDEGKGKMTDAIGHSNLINIIARLNSGENAGHTVYHDDKKYVFNLMPSGILTNGKKNIIGPECVMDPVNFMQKEISQLVKAGINYKDKLFVGNVHLVGPHHKVLDFALKPANSSTLMGISDIHVSKVSKMGLRLDHIFNSRETQESRLEKELRTYKARIKNAGLNDRILLDQVRKVLEKHPGKIPNHIIDFLRAKDKVEYVLGLYQKTIVDNPDFPSRTDTLKMLRDSLANGGRVLIEGPQSFFLSNGTEKHWESATSALTHASGIQASGLYNPKHRTAVITIFKTPGDSRVGRGANPSSFVPQTFFSDQGIESLEELGASCGNFDAIHGLYFKSIQENGILNPVNCDGEYSIGEAMAIASAREFGEKGATTGKPRVTGIFDCLTARHVDDVQGPYISISALDRGDSMKKVGLTVGYIYHNPLGENTDSNGRVYKNGDIIRIGNQYPSNQVLEHCHPIIKVMEGWKDTPIGVGKRKHDNPLPESVQKFIGTIERLTGLEVLSIGNGPNSEDLIYLKKAS